MSDESQNQRDQEQRDLADMEALRAQVDQVANGMLRRIDPGPRAMVIAVGVLILAICGALPWVDGTAGWQVLLDEGSGADKVDILPRVFAIGVFVFGFIGSGVSLGSRRWGIAWISTFGCGLVTVLGLVSIWSQQTTDSHLAGPGPGIGLILAVLTMLALVIVWVRVVWSRPGGVFDHATD
jgi:hypothetical protein